QLPDEPGRRPAGDADAAAWSGDPDQFVGGALVVGGEHDADCRQRVVERGVVERKVFGVRFAKVDVQVFGGRASMRRIDEGGHVVDARDVAEPAGGRQRDVPGAGRDVEHARARTQV